MPKGKQMDVNKDKSVQPQKPKKVVVEKSALFESIIESFENDKELKEIVNKVHAHVDIIPTGITPLDLASGGGIGVGVFTQIAGDEGVSKTSTVLQIIGNLQKRYGDKLVVVYLDTEYSLDEKRVAQLRADYGSMIYSTPNTIEKVFGYVNKIINIAKEQEFKKKGIITLVVWDSLASTDTEKVNVAESLSDVASEMGARARLLGVALRKYLGDLKDNNISMIIINQNRDVLNVGNPFLAKFGKKVTQPGGKAPKFAFYQMINLSVVERDKENGKQNVSFELEKNKNFVPFVKSVGVFDYTAGFVEPLSFLYFAKKNNFMKFSGGLEFSLKKYSEEFEQLYGSPYEKIKSEREFASKYIKDAKFKDAIDSFWKNHFKETIKVGDNFYSNLLSGIDVSQEDIEQSTENEEEKSETGTNSDLE